MEVKKQQLEPDMEQQTDSKLGKKYVKAVYCNLAYLTSMLSTSFRMWGWMNHKLESRFLGEMSITWDMQMISLHSNGRKWRGTKGPLDESKRGEWKSWLKTQHLKAKIMAFGPITSWQVDGETMETVQTLFSWGPKSLQMVTAAMKLKDACSLVEKL